VPDTLPLFRTESYLCGGMLSKVCRFALFEITKSFFLRSNRYGELGLASDDKGTGAR